MHPKSISMIQKQPIGCFSYTIYFKVKYKSILIGYHKSHGVGIRVI